MSDLPEPRDYAATASTAAGTFLLGGDSSSQASTSAFLAADSMAWEEGPALPQDMDYGPCAAQISPTSFLLLYGKTILEFDSSLDGPRSSAGWRPAGTWPDLLTCEFENNHFFYICFAKPHEKSHEKNIW